MHLFPPQVDRIGNTADFIGTFKGRDTSGAISSSRALGRLAYGCLLGLADNVSIAYDSLFDADPGSMRDTLLRPAGGRDPVRFIFPSLDQLMAGGVEPDLGLQLFSLQTETKTHTLPAAPAGTPDAHISIVRRSLRLQGAYILWDYQIDAPVAYGEFDQESPPFGFWSNEISADDWVNVAFEAILEIVGNSPMRGPKYMKESRHEQSNRPSRVRSPNRK